MTVEKHEIGGESAERAVSWKLVLLALVLVAGTCLLVHGCHQPPGALGADVSMDGFSAGRAYSRLGRLLGDEARHPLGTTANDRVCQRLITELKGLGLHPVIREHWVSNEHRVSQSLGPGSSHQDWVRELCLVRNVVVELPTENPDRRAILLVCHYDSVGAGPGAGDDGAAVAALLEVARALLADGDLPRPVILLFTDGEERGLMGARGFADHDPLAERVGMVVNFEARGVAGGSVMFETSADNRWIIAQTAAALARPMSSSAYVEIYRMMPNDSDLTVFMRDGMPGMNFAFVGGPWHYHTPGDDLRHLDRRSLQHHGENALGMVRQLLEADWPAPAGVRGGGDAVYTDLFARWVLSWPAGWGPWIAGTLMLVIGIWFVGARRDWTRMDLVTTMLGWGGVLLAAALLSGLGVLLRDGLGETPTPFPASMHLDAGLFCASGALGVLLVLLVLRRRPRLLVMVHGGALAVIGFVFSLTKTGFSYLFLLPAAAVALASLFFLRKRDSGPLLATSCILLGITTVVAWYPLFFRLPVALGVGSATGGIPPVAPASGVVMALFLLPILPLLVGFPRKVLLGSAAGTALLATIFLVLAVRTPPFTEGVRQRMNLVHVEEAGRESAQLVVSPWEGSNPGSLAGHPLSRSPDPLTLIEIPRALAGSASAVSVASAGLVPPDLVLLDRRTDGGVHTARLRLRPSEESQFLLAGIPDGVRPDSLELSGVAVSVPSLLRAGHRWIRVRGAPPEGVELVLSWTGPEEYALVLAGVRYGLPAHLAPIVRDRDTLPACPTHEGDRTLVWRRVLLPPR